MIRFRLDISDKNATEKAQLQEALVWVITGDAKLDHLVKLGFSSLSHSCNLSI